LHVTDGGAGVVKADAGMHEILEGQMGVPKVAIGGSLSPAGAGSVEVEDNSFHGTLAGKMPFLKALGNTQSINDLVARCD
jgi:hypothetical protein